MGPNYSVISPVYSCQNCLEELYLRLKLELEKITHDFEIILVDDASPDDSWRIIIELSQLDSRVKGIKLSRNFGQHQAITAGLAHCKGERIIVMDCDLQDQPEEIQKLVSRFEKGFDVVFARRINRQDNFMRRSFSKLFYRLFDYLTDNKSDSSIANFGIFSRKVIANYLRLNEKERLFPLIIKWLGFKIGYVDVNHSRRGSGRSSYNIIKLMNLAINAIVAQSNKPLKISIKIGFLMSFISFFYLIFLIIRKIIFDIPLGWTSIMVSIYFIGGMIFANFGLIGLYIGKIYDEIKNRPLYVISDYSGSFEANLDEKTFK